MGKRRHSFAGASDSITVANVLIVDQEKMIEDLMGQKVQLSNQIAILREQLAR